MPGKEEMFCPRWAFTWGKKAILAQLQPSRRMIAWGGMLAATRSKERAGASPRLKAEPWDRLMRAERGVSFSPVSSCHCPQIAGLLPRIDLSQM